MGKTLAELRAALEPGELQLYVELAGRDGPWWGARADELHALQTAQLVALHTGEDEPVSRHLPPWRSERQTAPPLILLDWDDAAPLLAAALGG